MPKQNLDTPTYSRNIGFDMMISYDSSNRTEYVGLAYPSALALTSAARWQIYKLTYDATSGGVEVRRYADSTDEFSKVWDDRTGYDYVDI